MSSWARTRRERRRCWRPPACWRGCNRLAPLRLAEAVQHERRGFVVDGHAEGRHLQFYYAPERRKLALDAVVQTGPADYLEVLRVVWFGNADIDLVRGGADLRRRFLDFVGAQVNAIYRPTQRAYERALRSRNHLLKASQPNWRQIAAFDGPLLEHGNALTEARARLLRDLQPHAAAGQLAVSEEGEELRLDYRKGATPRFRCRAGGGRGRRMPACGKPARVRTGTTLISS